MAEMAEGVVLTWATAATEAVAMQEVTEVAALTRAAATSLPAAAPVAHTRAAAGTRHRRNVHNDSMCSGRDEKSGLSTSGDPAVPQSAALAEQHTVHIQTGRGSPTETARAGQARGRATGSPSERIAPRRGYGLSTTGRRREYRGLTGKTCTSRHEENVGRQDVPGGRSPRHAWTTPQRQTTTPPRIRTPPRRYHRKDWGGHRRRAGDWRTGRREARTSYGHQTARAHHRDLTTGTPRGGTSRRVHAGVRASSSAGGAAEHFAMSAAGARAFARCSPCAPTVPWSANSGARGWYVGNADT